MKIMIYLGCSKVVQFSYNFFRVISEAECFPCWLRGFQCTRLFKISQLCFMVFSWPWSRVEKCQHRPIKGCAFLNFFGGELEFFYCFTYSSLGDSKLWLSFVTCNYWQEKIITILHLFREGLHTHYADKSYTRINIFWKYSNFLLCSTQCTCSRFIICPVSFPFFSFRHHFFTVCLCYVSIYWFAFSYAFAMVSWSNLNFWFSSSFRTGDRK